MADQKNIADMSVAELDAVIAGANAQVARFRDMADAATRVRDQKHTRQTEIDKVKREHGMTDEEAAKVVDVVVSVKTLRLSSVQKSAGK